MDREDNTISSITVAKHKDRKSTRLNSSHSQISYAVFCLKKKKKIYHSSLPLRYLNHFLPPTLVSTFLFSLGISSALKHTSTASTTITPTPVRHLFVMCKR